MNKEYQKTTGLNDKKFRRLIRKVEPLSSGLQENKWNQTLLSLNIKQELSKPSLLDIVLTPCPLTSSSTIYEVFMPSNIDDFVVSALTSNGLEMLLFKDETGFSRVTPAPLFEIEYRMEQVNPKLPMESIINGIVKDVQKFEGELLFDLLNKALRSQRNRLIGGNPDEHVTSALELIERENLFDISCVLNTRFYAKIRELIRQCSGTLYGFPVFKFSPEGRLNKNRNYFVSKSAGVVAKAPAVINITLSENEFSVISCVTRLGSMIFDRNGISAVED